MKNPWYSDYPYEDAKVEAQRHTTENGRFDFAYSLSDIDGLEAIMFLLWGGVFLAVTILTTLAFYMAGAEWSMTHWITMSVLSIIPGGFFFMLAISIIWGFVDDYKSHLEGKRWLARENKA